MKREHRKDNQLHLRIDGATGQSIRSVKGKG